MTWDLSALYTGFDDPAMEKDWEDADRLAKETAACVDIPEFLKGLEAFTGLTQKLGSMVLLTLAADADNEAALGRYDRLMRLDVALETLQSELKRRVGSAGGADAVLKAHPSLSPLAHLLRVAERLCAHTLPPEIEAPVLNMQVTGGRAFEKLRDELDANQTVDVPGMGLLTLTEARNLAYAADSAARKTAYEAEIAAYAKIETPMAACLSAIKGEALTLCALRGYESPLDEALEGANMQKETLDALWTATREFLPDFRRYLRAKARLLGHEGGLPFYDLFAPVGDPGETFTLSAARELLERVLGGFDGEMGALISEMFEGRRIDVYPRPGKQGGAFCSGVCPAGVSYILANFDGSMNAVSTLAHELGHAYHDRQLFPGGPLMADAPMPLCETASIFNETLTVKKLLEGAPRSEALFLLDQSLINDTQTVVDIYSRFLFESAVFEARKTRMLGAKDFCEMMLAAQKESYGDGLSALHPYMWACKSHYYSPSLHFYNFPYAFGLLFGKGVFARYEKMGAKAFVPEYRALLKATATGDVEDVALGVGIDVKSPAFWRESLQSVRADIDRFCDMV